MKGTHSGRFTPVREYDSELYLSGDVKKLKPIKFVKELDGKQGIISVINDTNIKIIQVNK